MKRVLIDDKKFKPEAGDSIGVRDCTENDVDIVEGRKGRCFPWFCTVYSGGEGKYVQVWKLTEVDEPSK